MTESTVKPEWLGRAATVVPMIAEIADGCEAPFKAPCFELLLGHWLRGEPGGDGRARAATPDREGSDSAEVGSDRVVREFLSPNGLNEADLETVIDMRSGEVLVHDLGKGSADVQRKLGGLVALFHFVKDGEFIFEQAELIEKCRRFGALDSKNFSANMRSASFNGVLTFAKEGASSWRVTKPGERYVAAVVRACVERTSHPGQTKLNVEIPPETGGSPGK